MTFLMEFKNNLKLNEVKAAVVLQIPLKYFLAMEKDEIATPHYVKKRASEIMNCPSIIEKNFIFENKEKIKNE